MRKVLCCVLVVCFVFGCIVSGVAESTLGRSYNHVLNGVTDDLDGNIYGWYVGDPNSTVVVITGLGNEQGAYDDNAVPVYTDTCWANMNVYWFAAEVNGRSGSIHDGFSKAELDMFAQAHYNNVKEIFPNASVFVVGGYSAGGWAISSLIDVILQNGGTLAAVFGLDCAPKNKLYDAFVNSIGMAHASDVPIFIGSSGVNVTGNRIEARTAKFAKQYRSLIDFYLKYDCKHGELCKNSQLIADLTAFVDEALGNVNAYEYTDEPEVAEDQAEKSTVMDDHVEIASNNNVEVMAVALRSVNVDEKGNYVFFFNMLDAGGIVVKICSVTLTVEQVHLLTGLNEIDDAALAACADYYIDALSPNN